jgi:hypothetical protein
MVNCVALTSDTPNAATANYLSTMERLVGLPTLLITWERNRGGLSRRLGRRPSHVIFVDDLNDPVGTFERLRRELLRRSLRVVNWINVPDTLTDTFLYCCEQLNLPIPFLGPYTRCRVKPLTRQILEASGHSSMAHEVLSVGAPALSTFSGPKVCKPITGSGSRDVQKVSTPVELAAYGSLFEVRGAPSYSIAGFRPREQFLMEDQLAGPGSLEIEVDGYAYGDEVAICALGYKHHEYDASGFREVAGVTYFPFSLESRRARDGKIVDWVTQVLTDLEFSGGVFHLEAMDLGDRIELIEINPRPGGGGVQPICQRLSGVVLATECMRLWLGLPPERKPSRSKVQCISYGVVYPDAPGRLVEIAGKRSDEIVTPLGKLRFSWEPLWTVGGPPFKGDREEYVGEAHFEGVAFPEQGLEELGQLIGEALREKGYWRIAPRTEAD